MPIQVLEADAAWTGGNTGGGGTPTGGGAPTTWSDATVPETGTLQILLGEGRMEGLVSQNGLGTDCLRSVLLDNTPVRNSDDSWNFKGLAMALVAGTNTQPSIKGITGTESETSVNVQVVQATPVVRSVTSNPSAVRVRISIPALKKISTSDGKESGNVARVKIERQNAGYNGGAWQEVTLDNSGIIEGGPFSTKFTKSFRVETPATGTWQIRVTRITADDPDAYSLSQTWWDAITEIVDARLRYPNRSIFSIRLNAKQFRSIPKINLHMRGSILQVPANYTPASFNWVTKTWTAATYATTGPGTSGGAWDGTFKEVWCNNPAWGFYQAASNTRWGAGTFLAASGLDKWSLYEVAQWCDAMVADGKGGTEPRMVCNLYMQHPQNAIKALGQLASIFWGVIYYASGLVVPVPDADTAPVALFTNANVEGGHFRYEGTARSARHTAAVASFINPDLGYAQDTAIYEDEAGIARYGYNALDIQAIGATSQGQALRLAKWTILTELMTSEVVGFTSGLEGSTVKPGDVVQIADQFRAGAARMGGRIVATATTTVIPLDAPVTLGAGAYTLRCQTATGMESRTVTTAAGTVSSLTVSPAFSSAPAIGSGWLLQAGTTASLWRVLIVKKAEGLKFEVAALKHDPAKYAALGLASGDVVPRTPRTTAAPAPAGLAVTSTTRVLNDRQQLTLNANWTLDGAVSYIAQASRDYGPWESMTVSGASAYLDGIQPGSWRVRVCGDWRGAGASPYATVAATVTASGTVPPWITNASDIARQSANLIKNGNSEDPNPLGYEAAGIYTGGGAYSGAKCRTFVSSSGAWEWLGFTPLIQCVPGEKLRYQGVVGPGSATAHARLVMYFYDSGQTWVSAAAGYDKTGTGWYADAYTVTVPAGASFVAFGVEVSGNPGDGSLIDNLYAERMQQAAIDAQATADAAQAVIAGITSDSIITNAERPPLKSLRASLAASVASAQSQADAMSPAVTHAALDSAWSTFTTNVDPILADTTDSTITKTTFDGWWSAVYSAITDLAGIMSRQAQTSANYADSLARSPHNLVKNGNSSDSGASAGTPESLGLYNSGTTSVLAPAQWVRLLTATTSNALNVMTSLVPCVAGDQFMAQCQGTFATTATGGSPRLLLAWFDAAGAWFDSTPSPAITATNSNYAAPSSISVSGSAPAGAVGVKICVYTDALASGSLQYVVNNFYACRKISAGMLEADLAIVGVIRDPSFTPGGSGSGPTGFKVSGPAFTTTYRDGATDANCHMELEGTANFGGYRVATVNDRLFTAYNRILNGSFYTSLNGWQMLNQGADMVYSASSDDSGSGSAAMTASSTASASIIQPFNCPKNTGTVNLTLSTACSATLGNNITATVKVYLFKAGTETLLATYTYSGAQPASPSWTARTIDVSNYVNGGGDFVLRIVHTLTTPAGDTVTIYTDKVNLTI